MSSPFHNLECAALTERVPTPTWRGGAALWALVWLIASGMGAVSCAKIQVEETPVAWEAAASCQSEADAGGASSSGRPQTSAPAVAMMDTYVVEIFELTDPNADDSACEVCLATRENCFIEDSSCMCGSQVPVSLSSLHQMLGGVHVGLPGKHTSLYCLRVMAVERTSQSESCACDPAWQSPERIRLCALSTPYAASPVPHIEMEVQCDAAQRNFKACVGK
jgi:hypothetical protein